MRFTHGGFIHKKLTRINQYQIHNMGYHLTFTLIVIFT